MAPLRTSPVMHSAEIRIANQLAEIGKVADLLDAFGRRHALSERVRHDMSIALEEVVSNIIHHAYRDNASHSISVCLRLAADELQAEIVDDGTAFDPLVHDAPKPSGSLNERTPGGLGLHFVKSLMDNVRYFRAEDGNHLTLVKRTAGPAVSAGGRSATQLSETIENGVTIIGISGRFDSTVAREVRERLSQLIGSGAHRMLLDLHGLEYISSAGFWSLLAIGREIETRQGRLALYGVGDEVKRLFDLGGFTGLFRICPTREFGLDAVRGSAS
ncbi:MAG TPA: anti-sigma factor antagonist [Burkholderiales bacterium]|nr:anti-sigma factor antagonist [Burkholderiales bacterium]